MLLHKVRGCKDWDDITTFNGVLHQTYKSACTKIGLLDDDNEWHDALFEASIWASARKLRNLYCTMLMFCQVTNPAELWERHWGDLTDDLVYNMRRETGEINIRVGDEERKKLGLVEIEYILNRNGRSLKEFPPMPLLDTQASNLVTNRHIREALDYDSLEEGQLFDTLFSTLNTEQRSVFYAVMKAYENKTCGLFFVHGSGGTEKTHLWRTLIANMRQEKNVVLSVGSSGIAALLLPNGKTGLGLFKVPLSLDEFSCCPINRQSELAGLIKEALLIIWDEAPMMHHYGFEVVDRTLKDILRGSESGSSERVFGGKLVVLGGDFRQTLPIVPEGGRQTTVPASLLESTI